MAHNANNPLSSDKPLSADKPLHADKPLPIVDMDDSQWTCVGPDEARLEVLDAKITDKLDRIATQLQALTQAQNQMNRDLQRLRSTCTTVEDLDRVHRDIKNTVETREKGWGW